MLAIIKRAKMTDLLDRDPKGLDQEIENEGENMSSGEKQLLCICRAALRKSKIVILDEATANIDSTTEKAVQTLINTEFKDATMLTIAHRLNTIMGSDKVMVLDDGMCAEFDTPANLLEDEFTIFSDLVKKFENKN